MGESLVDKIVEKIHAHDSSSSSSDSDDDRRSSLKAKINRLFGRERSVHGLLGGGKAADVLLWRNKNVSLGVIGGATAIWILFDVLEYHFLTLVSHALILGLVIFFVWSNGSTFLKKSPPRIPQVIIPEKPVLEFVSDARIEINRAFSSLRDIASGKDLKKFLLLIVVLWALSVLGSLFDFLSLVYLTTVSLLTLPSFYEKYEDEIDSFAHGAAAELKKQYAAFDAKVLSKIPRGLLQNRKRD
ncbi:hypothetical protein M569_03311 [Genlisea aurea]|uniref:Reticulon-like protein n=1 Tax=Genlisea aurea TaxID=192259 RepID=S8EFQ2_9LAMI|nr:hypothetical protein M569_03311 [Genlisea aurea]